MYQTLKSAYLIGTNNPKTIIVVLLCSMIILFGLCALTDPGRKKIWNLDKSIYAALATWLFVILYAIGRCGEDYQFSCWEHSIAVCLASVGSTIVVVYYWHSAEKLEKAINTIAFEIVQPDKDSFLRQHRLKKINLPNGRFELRAIW